jgi:hypothetical protein
LKSIFCTTSSSWSVLRRLLSSAVSRLGSTSRLLDDSESSRFLF